MVPNYQSLTADNFYYKFKNGFHTVSNADAGANIACDLWGPNLVYDSTSDTLSVTNCYARAAAYQYGMTYAFVNTISVKVIP